MMEPTKNSHSSRPAGIWDLLTFLRQSVLHVIALWAFFVVTFRSSSFAFLLTVVIILLIHFYRFPIAAPELTNSICLQGEAAKDGGSPVIFGHRGAAVDMPENTLSAFRQCRSRGADGIEIDVEFTSDEVAIILHDDTVDRTTDGTGRINRISFEDARNLNAAAKHPKGSSLRSEPLPTLEETLTLCLEIGLHVFIEVKSAAFSGMKNANLAADAIAELYSRFPALYSSAMVCSFDPRVLFVLRRRNPDIVTAMIWRPWVNSYNLDGSPKVKDAAFRTFLAMVYDVIHAYLLHGFLWYFLGFSIMSTNKNDLSANSIRWWRKRGVVPVTWTVNTQVEKDFFARHGVPVMTDSMIDDVVEST